MVYFCISVTEIMERRTILALCIAIAIVACVPVAAFYLASAPPAQKQTLVLATTTSLYDTGLLEHLEPKFEEKYNVELYIISAGTGIALEYAERGDVDLLIIHDRAREDKFVEDGYGLNRRCIAYNYFLIVGPADDPAGIKAMNHADAFRKIMEEGIKNSELSFVSRGDNSGTHAREKLIWRNAGYNYEKVRSSGPWYVEAGKGMGATLLMVSEISAYTLTDLGTFLTFAGELDLVPLVEKGDILLNVYGAIAVNPKVHTDVNIEMANNFINFLMSEETQRMIGEYGVDEYGTPLFYPVAGKCKEVGCPTWVECSKQATYEKR
jgi:tungstate transport system substrate-binding protein